jgi:hypothetical protein
MSKLTCPSPTAAGLLLRAGSWVTFSVQLNDASGTPVTDYYDSALSVTCISQPPSWPIVNTTRCVPEQGKSEGASDHAADPQAVDPCC